MRLNAQPRRSSSVSTPLAGGAIFLPLPLTGTPIVMPRDSSSFGGRAYLKRRIQ